MAEKVELLGVLFPAGNTGFANTAAPNRDPASYDDPNRFDITGDCPRYSISVQACTTAWGANLARREIAEALKTVTRRIVNPRKNGLSGPASLPIAFDTPLTQAGEP